MDLQGQSSGDDPGAHELTNARRFLDQAEVAFRGEPVGTVASLDPGAGADALNYDQVFVRDFVPVALLRLAEGRAGVVRHFLEAARELQAQGDSLYCYRPGAGLIPASFKVAENGQSLVPGYGGHAIGRVAPVDSSLWWLYLLRVYTRATGDWDLAQRDDFQVAIRRVLDLCLTGRFDMYPTLLVPDGSFMVDRRMGVYGYPLEVQVLFLMALRSADELLAATGEGPVYREAVQDRIGKLVYFLRTFYWLDLPTLNRMYRAGTEEYGLDAMNAFNIVPGSIPGWLLEWLPENGGYFAGNLGPSRLDFRFFSQGNLLAVLSGLADPHQAQAILELVSARAQDLFGAMPIKICFPAMEDQEWRTMTGGDPKNTPWSYHNGGSWPVLLWALAAAGVQLGRSGLVQSALDAALPRLQETRWPEYFDGRDGRLVGKEARLFQSWSMAGPLLAECLLSTGEPLGSAVFTEEILPEACPV